MSTPVFVEVTNTLHANWTTGLQRLTRELLSRLPRSEHSDIHFVPITWCDTHDGYRRLTDEERVSLVYPGQPPSSPLDTLPSWAARTARRAMSGRVGTRVKSAVRNRGRRPRAPVAGEELLVGELPHGSVFLDMEPSWHDPLPRAELLPRLRRRGIPILVVHPDVMPELHPEWFLPEIAKAYDEHLRAHIGHSTLFMCISAQSEIDLLAFCAEQYPDHEIDTCTMTLGADFRPLRFQHDDAALPAAVKRYMLSVSTLEPRKNYPLLLDAFDRLRSDYADLGLVIVGKPGWSTESVVRRITSHPEHRRRLIWYRSADDTTLGRLYDGAHLTVTPSFYEGLGLPVMESLQRGSVALSSSGGGLPEAGGDFAEYFDPHDLDGLVRLIRCHLDDESYHRERLARVAQYVAPTWDGTAEEVLDAVRRVIGEQVR